MSTAITAPASLLRVADLSAGQLNALLDLADAMRDGPGWWASPPRDGAVACVFHDRSAGARASFEVAVRRLGLRPVLVGPDELPADEASLGDAARVWSSTVDAIVVGIPAQGALAEISRGATVPVVNALTDDHHPCQALADLLTIRRRFGHLGGLRLAYVGAAGNVLHSLMEAGALAGMQVVVATPRGREPQREVARRAAGLAAAHGGSLELEHDPRAAVIDADVVYTSPWTADDPGDAQPYRVDATSMRLACAHAVFLHGLPTERGEEVAAEVIDGPASIVWEQAANGLPSRQALLHALVTGTLDG